MAGIMRKRQSRFTAQFCQVNPMAKGFYAPQKDTSRRLRRRMKLNDYNQQKR